MTTLLNDSALYKHELWINRCSGFDASHCFNSPCMKQPLYSNKTKQVEYENIQQVYEHVGQSTNFNTKYTSKLAKISQTLSCLVYVCTM